MAAVPRRKFLFRFDDPGEQFTLLRALLEATWTETGGLGPPCVEMLHAVGYTQGGCSLIAQLHDSSVRGILIRPQGDEDTDLDALNGQGWPAPHVATSPGSAPIAVWHQEVFTVLGDRWATPALALVSAASAFGDPTTGFWAIRVSETDRDMSGNVDLTERVLVRTGCFHADGPGEWHTVSGDR